MDARAKKQLRKEMIHAIEKSFECGIDDYHSYVFGWLQQSAGITPDDLLIVVDKAKEKARKNFRPI